MGGFWIWLSSAVVFILAQQKQGAAVGRDRRRSLPAGRRRFLLARRHRPSVHTIGKKCY